ncbi:MULTISPECIES: hypothetical protein [Convivina]|uniref:Uncharacterized protein n=2 Tax=Convivina TaxID=1697027 RepID=A0A2U1D7A8_9LACO|nr:MULTISPECIES: hypothetical protein [Convivina]PVY83479.1 hypothetical protein C7384_10787 [Convivina intestini]CAH1856209.1 hypothetical protein R077815_01351 [Convivina sp. LMG 32447]CAH1857147.1 hypothetical protein LMG032447_01458 [Convivina sp. LMG 32447]SDC23339.1 hypothetical protein SAMN05216341_1265 [Leuconostocaceae bacterium R-53105]
MNWKDVEKLNLGRIELHNLTSDCQKEVSENVRKLLDKLDLKQIEKIQLLEYLTQELYWDLINR